MAGLWPIEFRRLQRDSQDRCSHCGILFSDGAMITIGYSSQRKAVRVGDCCKSMVAETAETVRWEYRGYDVPPWTATLWRYTDFAKFVSMLKEGALHFSRLDEIGDRFELAKGLRERKDFWDAYHLEEIERCSGICRQDSIEK